MNKSVFNCNIVTTSIINGCVDTIVTFATNTTHILQDCSDVLNMQVCFLCRIWFKVCDSEMQSWVITPLCHYYREEKLLALRLIKSHVKQNFTGMFDKGLHKPPFKCSRFDTNIECLHGITHSKDKNMVSDSSTPGWSTCLAKYQIVYIDTVYRYR